MARRDPGSARGKPRTKKSRPAGKRAVPQQSLRRSFRAVPESLDALAHLTRKELLSLARREGLRARSRLKKAELARALWSLLKEPTLQADTASAPDVPDWEMAPLPAAYGVDRLVLMPIDPYWVHAYWEIGPGSHPEAGSGTDKENGQARWILRVYDVTFIDFDGTNAHSSFDIEIAPQAKNWYINLWSPGKSLCAELGLVHAGGGFAPLLRSNVIQTPPAWASPNTEEHWMRTQWGEASLIPVQAPVASEAAAPGAHPGPRRPPEPPGAGGAGAPRRPPERLRAEEYRRFLEGTRRMRILGGGEIALPPAAPPPSEELADASDAHLSSAELVKKR